jgi:hypothetical protein
MAAHFFKTLYRKNTMLKKQIKTDEVPMKGDLSMLLLLLIPVAAFILWGLVDNMDGHKGMRLCSTQMQLLRLIG